MSDQPVAPHQANPSPSMANGLEDLAVEEPVVQANQAAPAVQPAPAPQAAPARQAATPPSVQEHPAISPGSNGQEQSSLELLMDVTLRMSVELGRTTLTVRQILDLQKGSVVELDRNAGDAVDIYVNDHMIARGDVVVVDDKFGVRITEIITPGKVIGEL